MSGRPPVSVSVIIPTHERDALLAEALDSALAQTLAPIEIIVVDDTARDGPSAVVQAAAQRAADARGAAIALSLSRCARRGPASSRNAGAHAASGEVLAFLDDDDLWPPEHLAAATRELSASDAALSLSWVNRFDGRGERPFKRIGEGAGVELLMRENPGVVGSNIVIRADAFAALGGFDEQLRVGEDKDLLIRALDAGLSYCVVRRPAVRLRRDGGARVTSARGLDEPSGLAAFLRKHGRRMSGAARRELEARIAVARALNAERGVGARVAALWTVARRGGLRHAAALLRRSGI